MATDTQDQSTPSPDTDDQDLVTLTLTYQSKPHTLSLPLSSTVSDLSCSIATTFHIPPTNQKLLVSSLGLLKPPFKDPSLPITSLLTKKITLIGSTATEASSIAEASAQAARVATRQKDGKLRKVQAYKTHDWKKEQEEGQYTFLTLRPLPYLPNPQRSLQFLQRLKDDAGIKAAMRKHKFTVPLLTEMNPVEHTSSTHEGTSRTLGLNRNRGEVIELRLRTDAYDGYRDYKTIRNTLCHELAHNVHGPHDRNFWELCKEIEREVQKADWRDGGRSVGEEVFYEGGGGDEVHDDGGWTGGEFVLGAGTAESSGVGSSGEGGGGLSRREVLAKAAEERMRRQREAGERSRGREPGSGS